MVKYQWDRYELASETWSECKGVREGLSNAALLCGVHANSWRTGRQTGAHHAGRGHTVTAGQEGDRHAGHVQQVAWQR